MKKSKNYRELQFENEHVAVWKVTITPDCPFETQVDERPSVVIGLQQGDSSSLAEKHQVHWMTPQKRIETDLKEGLEVMVVEMKHPTDSPLPKLPLS